MAIDVTDLVHSLGISLATNNQPAENNRVYNTGVKAPKPAGFSPSNLVHSAVNLAGSAVGAIGHAAIDGFTGLAHGIGSNVALGKVGGSALPGHGNNLGGSLGAQDKMISDRQTALETGYKNGSITKDQYKQGYKDLLATSNQNIQAHQKFTADTQKNYYSAGKTATDYAKAAGTVLTVAAPFLAPGAGALEAIPGAEKVAGAVDSTLAAGKGNVVGKLVRNAVVTQPTIQQGTQVVNDVNNKKYGDAAKSVASFAALAAAPGLVGKYGPGVADSVGSAIFGKAGSEINKLKFSDGAVSDFLSTLSGSAQKKYTNIAKQVNQRIADEGRSASKVTQYYANGKSIGETTVKDFLDQANKHIGAEKAIIKDVAQGVHPGLSVGDGKKVIAARWDAAARAKVVEELQKGTDIKQLIDDGTIPNNPGLKAEINNKIASGDIEGIKKIFAASPATKSAELDKLIAETGGIKKYAGGYVPSIAPSTAANYVSPSKAAELAANIEAKPGLAGIGKAITKAGISPVANEPGALQSAIKTNFKGELGKLDTNLSGKTESLYSAVLKKAGDSRGITDVRLLSRRALGQVLSDENITSISAGDLKKALINSQLKVPASLQSFGGKLTSGAIKYIPGEKTFLKAQSYGRFGINPIFASKVAIKSGYLGAIDSNGGRIAGPVSKEVDTYVKGLGGAKSLGGTTEDILGTPGATAAGQFGVDKIQHNIAGNLVQNILKKNGASIEDIAKNPQLKQQVDHAVQMIYGYPKGGVLDSNLMKSLNVAVFPARFEAKVLGATAKAIINQPPVVRASILNGLLKTQNFLNSPKGQQWKKDNSELVDVARYFTPLDTLSKVMGAVTGQGHGVNLKDLGAIGGLPFGVFTQILTDQGVNLGPLGSSDYVPTKTGVAIGRQIPETTKAKISTALGDIISQSFSYPGAQLGLPSKASIVKNIVTTASGGALGTKKDEFKTVGGQAQPSTESTPAPYIKNAKFLPAPTTNLGLAGVKPRVIKGKRPKTLAKHIGQPF
jgi:hypothetical protein